jgi:hypothetical protein
MDKNSKILKSRPSEAVVQSTDNADKIGYNSINSQTDPEMVTVIFCMESIFTVSTPSGALLTFSGAGSGVKVIKADADYLLGLKQGGAGCCGGQPPTPLFVKA